MINMKMSKAEAKEESGMCSPSGDSDLPAYPYGLSIYLCDETMKKLGISEPPDVGQRFLLTAVVEVTSSGVRKTQDGVDSNADLQITDMDLQPESGGSTAQALYGAPVAKS
jgi:hypothetical protein